MPIDFSRFGKATAPTRDQKQAYQAPTYKPAPQEMQLGRGGQTASRDVSALGKPPTEIQTWSGPKVYETGSAGSGFVNLGHMLDLNRSSGQKSAQDLARRTKEAGKNAQAAIGSAYDDFKKAADEGTFDASGYRGMATPTEPATFGEPNNTPPNNDSTTNVGPTRVSLRDRDPRAKDANYDMDRLNQAMARAKEGYRGPNSLEGRMGQAYQDLQKSVGEANDRAANLSQGGNGVAAQVAKETGLSPAQAAASAFYMGVNNADFKEAGRRYSGLNDMLSAYGTRATDYANLGRQRTNASEGILKDQISEAQAFWDKVKQDEDPNVVGSTAYWQNYDRMLQDQQTNEANSKNVQMENRGERIVSHGQAHNNVQRGMPTRLAYGGIDYDRWVAEGMPTEEQWIERYGEIPPPIEE